MSETPPQVTQSSPSSFSQAEMIRFEAQKNPPDSHLFFAGFLVCGERIASI